MNHLLNICNISGAEVEPVPQDMEPPGGGVKEDKL